MCNANCVIWVFKNVLPNEIEGKRVLEIGSLDVNGSPRIGIEHLKPSEYIGVDLVKGDGVDIISKCENLCFDDESFDLIISTCTLEHIEDWKTSIQSIKRVCKRGGKIIIIVPSRWPYHDYPSDYWRYSKDDMVRIFSDCKIEKLDTDFMLGRDSEGKATPFSLVYIKCMKPENFVEADLDFELERVIPSEKDSLRSPSEVWG